MTYEQITTFEVAYQIGKGLEKMSLNELAQKSSIPENHLCAAINEGIELDFDELDRLCNVLCISINVFQNGPTKTDLYLIISNELDWLISKRTSLLYPFFCWRFKRKTSQIPIKELVRYLKWYSFKTSSSLGIGSLLERSPYRSCGKEIQTSYPMETIVRNPIVASLTTHGVAPAFQHKMKPADQEKAAHKIDEAEKKK